MKEIRYKVEYQIKERLNKEEKCMQTFKEEIVARGFIVSLKYKGLYENIKLFKLTIIKEEL